MTIMARGLAFMLAACLLLPAGQAFTAERTFKLSAGDPADAPGPQGARKFAELLEGESDGALKLKVFPSAMIGNDVQMLGALPAGTVDFALVGAPTLVGLVKEFGALDLPYQFNSLAEVDVLLDGPLGQQLLAKLEAKGLVGLGFWELGFRDVSNSKRPIERWEDLKGLKIRTVQSPIFRTFFDHLGANAQPMPINEVFSALETRAIDAQENPVSVIAAQRFNEVQPYLSQTEHIYTAYVLLMSKKVWDSLDEPQRASIRSAADQARSYQRQLARKANQERLEELQAAGMKVNGLTDAERQRFIERARQVSGQARETIGGEFFDAWQAALASLRGGQ
jgi:tripartite ATP-independent transporter DctP family solute receptor